jgi:hypothetical protein
MKHQVQRRNISKFHFHFDLLHLLPKCLTHVSSYLYTYSEKSVWLISLLFSAFKVHYTSLTDKY